MKKLSHKNFMYISFIIVFTFCVVVVLYIFAEKNKEKYVNSSILMDKKLCQIIYGNNCEYVTNLVKSEASKIEEELSCDFYGSDVQKINDAECKWVKVGDTTINVLQKLIGVSYYLKEYSPLFKKNKVSSEILDCNLIKIDEKFKRVKLENENIQISVDDAIEGAICNRAIEIYKEEKISKAIVQFGNTTGYLNYDDGEVKDGFISEQKESNKDCKFFHPSDAIVSCIISKALLSMNTTKKSELINFFT